VGGDLRVEIVDLLVQPGDLPLVVEPDPDEDQDDGEPRDQQRQASRREGDVFPHFHGSPG